jgi:hypothetical protein
MRFVMSTLNYLRSRHYILDALAEHATSNSTKITSHFSMALWVSYTKSRLEHRRVEELAREALNDWKARVVLTVLKDWASRKQRRFVLQERIRLSRAWITQKKVWAYIRTYSARRRRYKVALLMANDYRQHRRIAVSLHRLAVESKLA